MRQLMAAASLDALTGCLSRGAFEERLDHESLLAERHYATFSVIVADLDNLKMLNDANGHHCGDRALNSSPASCGRPPARPTSSAGSAVTSSPCCCTRPTRRRQWPPLLGCATALHEVTGSDWVTASIGVSTWQGPNDDPRCCSGEPTRRSTWPSAPAATAPRLGAAGDGDAGGAAVAAGGRATHGWHVPRPGGRLTRPSRPCAVRYTLPPPARTQPVLWPPPTGALWPC